jgi:hypothetical protein
MEIRFQISISRKDPVLYLVENGVAVAMGRRGSISYFTADRFSPVDLHCLPEAAESGQ